MSERRDVVGLGVTSLTSALWTNALGLLFPALAVVVVWMLTPQQNGLGADLGSALKFSSALWVASHLTPIITSSGSLSLFPLVLVALPAYLLTRSSRKAARELEIADTREAMLLTLGVALAHSVVVTLVSALISSESLRFRPLQTLGVSLVIALCVVGIAVFKESGAWEDLRDVVPEWLRAGVLGSAVSLMILLALSGVLLVTLVVVHRTDIAAVSNSLGNDVFSQVLVLLLSLMYVPTIWGWTLSAMTGAGTHVGAGAVLALGAGTPSALPPFPLLAALPDSIPTWTRALPALVIIAACVGVLVAWKRTTFGDVLSAGVVVVCAVLCIGAVALITGGSLGGGNLAHIGPHARHAFMLALGELALGALIPFGIHALKQRQR